MPAKAGPDLFGGVGGGWFGARLGSIAKVYHSRRAGSSGTNEVMICRLMSVMCGGSDWLVVVSM